jgi:hypothetical protein
MTKKFVIGELLNVSSETLNYDNYDNPFFGLVIAKTSCFIE